MKTLAIAAVAFAAMTTASAAQSYRYADQIDRREANQEYRIQQGVRSGELTRREYLSLEAEQARIRQLEARAKRDGHITAYEAREIRAAQNAASRHIEHEKHDSERAGTRYGQNGNSGLWKRRWW